MPVKINGLPGGLLPKLGEGANAKGERLEASASQAKGGETTSGDTVRFTARASQLQRLTSTLAELPVVDARRVEAVQTAIGNSTYEIDAPRVAEKIIEFETSLD